MSRLAPLLLALAILSCDNATGVEASRSLGIGQTIEGEVAPNDTLRYVIRVNEQTRFVIVLESQTGAVRGAFARREAVDTFTFDGGNQEPFLRNAMRTVTAEPGTFDLTITGAGTFRLQLVAAGLDPETVPKVVKVNTVVPGEALDVPGDIDDFIFAATRGQELVIYFALHGPPGEGSAALSLLTPDGSDATGSAPTRGALQLITGSGRYRVATDGPHRIRISKAPFAPQEIGAYSFYIRTVNRTPEFLPAAAVLDDTTDGESVDYADDIDEFTVTGAPGAEYNIYLQSVGMVPEGGVQLHAFDAEPDHPFPDPAVTASASDGSLFARSTGLVRMPPSGRLNIRVTPWAGATHGRYRFYVQSVDPRPELAPSTVVWGDSVLTETIGKLGDVDDFIVHVPARTEANIVLENARGASPGLFAELFVGGEVVAAAARHGTDTLTQSTRFTLPAGQHRLRVRGAVREGGFLGAYRIFLYPIDSRPEGVPAVVHIGDDIRERLDPLGDIDIYSLVGTRGDHFRVLFEGAPPPGGSFGLWLADHTPGMPSLAGMSLGDWSHGPLVTPRIMLSETGTFTMFVTDGDAGRSRREGSYHIQLIPYDPSPEHTDRIIQVGDTMVNEAIDDADDVDEFILRGTPGSDVVIFLYDRTMVNSTVVRLELVDPVTKIVRPWQESPAFLGAQGVTGRYATLPSTGELMLRLLGAPAAPYALTVLPINRAPETAAASIALGDTITSESIDTRADVDEFRFAAPAVPAQLGVLLPTGSATAYGVDFDVVNAQTGTQVMGVRPLYRDPRTEYIVVSVPAGTGEYILRVRGHEEWAGVQGYRFFIRATP